jgi:hypothetical protein
MIAKIVETGTTTFTNAKLLLACVIASEMSAGNETLGNAKIGLKIKLMTLNNKLSIKLVIISLTF